MADARVVGEDDEMEQPESPAFFASSHTSSSHADAIPRRSTSPALRPARAAVQAFSAKAGTMLESVNAHPKSSTLCLPKAAAQAAVEKIGLRWKV